MEKRYIVLKDADGELRPMAFITKLNEAGKIRAEAYKPKMEEGDKMVVVEMTEVAEYSE